MFFDLDAMNEYIALQERKDKNAIKRAEKRMQSRRRPDKVFQTRTENAYVVIDRSALSYSRILKDYFTGIIETPLCECVFNRPFNQKTVVKAFKNKKFVAFLIESNLLRRTLKLSECTNGEFKIRLYLAIINFDKFGQ